MKDKEGKQEQPKRKRGRPTTQKVKLDASPEGGRHGALRGSEGS